MSRTPPRLQTRGGSQEVDSEGQAPNLAATYSLSVAGGARRKVTSMELPCLVQDKKEEAGSVCDACREEVKENQSGIMCDLCDGWFHSSCLKLSKKVLDFYRMNPKSATWVCYLCKEGNKRMRDRVDMLKTENAQLKDVNSQLMRRLNEVENMVRRIRDDIKAEVLTEIRQELSGDQRETEERRKRECNLVVHNVADTENVQDDKNVIENIIANELNLTDIKVKEVSRIKTREVNGERRHPAPLIVKCHTIGQKWAVIGRAKNLRESRNENYRKIMIFPDMTQKEREVDKKLRAELKERRDRGERDIYISKGRIVNRSSR